jgi:hypothetical protein
MIENPTIELLKVTGSPFVPAAEAPHDTRKVRQLYELAVKNKMPALYLQSLEQQKRLGELVTEYERETNNRQEIIEKALAICRLLDSNSIDCVVWKTISSCPVSTTDIDVLVMDSSKFDRAAELLSGMGYNSNYERAPLGGHLHLPRGGIFVDVRSEIAVSHIIYVNKNKLSSYITRLKVGGGGIKVFVPKADLAVLLAHSVISEQMYLLKEYYATLYYLAQMDKSEIDGLIDIVRENHISLAAKAHLAITAALHEVVYDRKLEIVEEIVGQLGSENREVQRLIKSRIKMPHKFHTLTLAGAILEKLQEGKAVRSLGKEILSMLNPFFAQATIRKVAHLRRRES